METKNYRLSDIIDGGTGAPTECSLSHKM